MRVSEMVEMMVALMGSVLDERTVGRKVVTMEQKWVYCRVSLRVALLAAVMVT